MSHQNPPASVHRIVNSISSISMLKEALQLDDFQYPLDDNILFDLKVVKEAAKVMLLSPEAKRKVFKWVLRVKRCDLRHREACRCPRSDPPPVAPSQIVLDGDMLQDAVTSALKSVEGQQVLITALLSNAGQDLLASALHTPAGIAAMGRAISTDEGQLALQAALRDAVHASPTITAPSTPEPQVTPCPSAGSPFSDFESVDLDPRTP